MTITKIQSASFAILSLSTSCFAQTKPALMLSLQSSLGKPTVANVSNTYGQPATAFLLLLKRFNSAGVQKFELHRFYDPLVNLPEHPLAPGETVTISLGSPFPDSSKPDDVQLVGAVFADGKTSGEEAWVSKILRQRLVLKSALQKMIEMCDSYAQLEDGKAFSKHFDDYLQASSQQLNGDDAFVFNFVVGDAIRNIEPSLSPFAAGQKALKLSKRYRAWKDQIDRSLPAV